MLRTSFATSRLRTPGALLWWLCSASACEPPPTNTPTYWLGNGPTLDGGGSVQAKPVQARDAEAPSPAQEPDEPPPVQVAPKLDARPTVTASSDARPEPDATPPTDGSAPPLAGGMISAACMVQVTVTTAPENGQYEPRNIGAVWVADSTGKFIKSLEVWAARRIQHLTAWNRATSAAGLARNTVDAITAATISNHRTHTSKWNCTDAKKVPVAQGKYRLYMEMTESNGAGPNRFVEFTLGEQGATVTAPDAASFKGVKLVITP